jgi:hypothetical protein
MASAEVNSRPQPLFWRHLGLWIQSIPRSALLSMIGPLVLCVCGYLGWRFYGAPRLDLAYYGLKKENIHLSPAQPSWMRTTKVLDDVFQGSSLANMSLLDSQTPIVLARVFDAHPCVRATQRVERMAGQVMVKLEYRLPVAMVACQVPDQATGKDQHSFLPVDADAVLLKTDNFLPEDVPKYISIYAESLNSNHKLVDGKPFDDSRVKEAVKLCQLLQPIREAAKITRVYVYPSRRVERLEKALWFLEIETADGPRIQWGSAPGLEGFGEPTAETKIKQLLSAITDSKQWSQEHIRLAGDIQGKSK